jgi:MATE family multidrug resistance protein
MLLGQAGQVILQLVDTVMIGQVGPVPLAGAALAGNLVMFALYFAYGSLGAVAPKVAQAFGKNHPRAVVVLSQGGMLVGLGVGLFLALALSALVPVLGWMGQPKEVVEVTGVYLFLIAWSLPFAMLSLVVGQTAEALNRPWPVFGFLFLAVAVNIGLNWLFIFGNWGFPAMGLAGAGLATLIARIVQTAGILSWVAWEKHWQQIGLFRVRLRRLWTAARQLFCKGLPVAGQDVLEGGSFALGGLMLGWIGTVALAANQVTLSIASLAWMFPVALATATNVCVAQAIGRGELNGARQSGIAGVLLGVGLMGLCAAVYISFGSWLAGLFTDDPEVRRLASVLVTIAGVYQISDAVQSISLGALRGMLDNRVPLVVNAVCYWGLSLPTVYLLAFVLDWGAVGVWIGYLPWMMLTGGFFLLRFLQKTKQAVS